MTRSARAQAKQAERDIAKAIGGRRLRAGEYVGPGDIDVVSDSIIGQVKHRTMPSWMAEGLRQIEEAENPDLRYRILFVVDKPRKRGERDRRILAVIDVDDLMELLEER